MRAQSTVEKFVWAEMLRRTLQHLAAASDPLSLWLAREAAANRSLLDSHLCGGPTLEQVSLQHMWRSWSDVRSHTQLPELPQGPSCAKCHGATSTVKRLLRANNEGQTRHRHLRGFPLMPSFLLASGRVRRRCNPLWSR